jgi:hypothetical protein
MMPLSGHMHGVVKWAAFVDRLAGGFQAAAFGSVALIRLVTGRRNEILVPVSTDANGVADLARRIRQHAVIEPTHAFRQAA